MIKAVSQLTPPQIGNPARRLPCSMFLLSQTRPFLVLPSDLAAPSVKIASRSSVATCHRSILHQPNSHEEDARNFFGLPRKRSCQGTPSESEMEVATGVVKHVLLVKFKEDVSQEKIDEIATNLANLVSVIEPMKDFHWGTDVSLENKTEGFTHLFVSTFESTEGVAEYFYHPAHVEFGKKSVPYLEKFIVFDYKPSIVKH